MAGRLIHSRKWIFTSENNEAFSVLRAHHTIPKQRNNSCGNGRSNNTDDGSTATERKPDEDDGKAKSTRPKPLRIYYLRRCEFNVKFNFMAYCSSNASRWIFRRESHSFKFKKFRGMAFKARYIHVKGRACVISVIQKCGRSNAKVTKHRCDASNYVKIYLFLEDSFYQRKKNLYCSSWQKGRTGSVSTRNRIRLRFTEWT